MSPFAYQLLVYSYGEIETSKVLPSCRGIIAHTIATCDPEWLERGKVHIKAFYPDGEEVEIDPRQFRFKMTLDIKALRVEARAMIAKDAEQQAEWMKELKGTVTGSPWLCDMGEDAVVEGLIHERQWRWRKDEEIDWAALDAQLIR